jgi:hypothetical protein
MKHAYHIKTRVMLLAMLGIVCVLLTLPSIGNAQTCTVYCPDGSRPRVDCSSNSDPCSSSSGSRNSSPGYDYGAAQRAREAEAERQRQQAEAERIERERRAEEKRQKDAAFIRDRDVAANMLKGSTGTNTSQLKGLSGTDNYGLKGSGTDAGAQLKSVERHSRDAQLQGKDTARETARTGFGKASGNLVYTDKKKQQIPPSALDRQVPAAAQKDPQVQQSLAWYRKLDNLKAETTQKITAIKEQQKKGTGDAAVLAAQLGTLTNQSKQIDKDQAKVTETVKKQVKNLGFNLVESPETTTTEVNKK